MPSFDVVSKVDWQEVDNALNQTLKEVIQRYDFKGTNTTITRKDEVLHIDSADAAKVGAAYEVLLNKCGKRGVAVNALEPGKVEPAGGSRAKQDIKIKSGIDQDAAKKIVKVIKDSKLKVQAAIQGDLVRVTGKNRDDLQAAIALLRKESVDRPLQYENFRD